MPRWAACKQCAKRFNPSPTPPPGHARITYRHCPACRARIDEGMHPTDDPGEGMSKYRDHNPKWLKEQEERKGRIEGFPIYLDE